MPEIHMDGTGAWAEVDLEDAVMVVKLTEEGVIFDVFSPDGAELFATQAMTYDEWAEKMLHDLYGD